ncbi:dithiol-disulfide isomerase [Pasteurellaceae bacterium Pebbles2]|nr:dithiol-disulfide isomerase [Pasteurellaceae bacterium Pebbles2]
MSSTTHNLFSNTWNVRISDPGEEGAQSHFFETIYITLDAHVDGDNIVYEFTRKVENEVKIHRTFNELNELFKFLADYLDPVALGGLGVKIGQLGLAK